MDGHDQGAHFDFAHVLQLINNDCDTSGPVRRRFAHGHEQLGKVCLQVAAVCGARFRVNAQTKLSIAHFELDGSDKAAQHAQAALDLLTHVVHAVQREQSLAQGREQKQWQRLAFMRLNQQGLVALPLSHFAHAIEQNGFTHPAQPHHEHTLFTAADFHARQKNLHGTQ